MGCTPSKQVEASREDSNGSDHDASSCEQVLKDHHQGVGINGNSKSTSNGSFPEKNKNNKANSNSDSKTAKSRPVLTTSKTEKKCTQSQLDFFEMLDKKIEAGPDYISEDERASRAWAEAR
ncbi:uncharacterized protein C1orf21 homolog [Rhopilema esculentum]|uniref:uncharacterized protein C1orf21 homolog n=1 Tax=Rhopilema esculentum TaxID=499914 RepID=UPI0031D72470